MLASPFFRLSTGRPFALPHIALLLTLGALAVTSGCRRENAVPEGALVAAWLPEPVTIDGRLDDPGWRGAGQCELRSFDGRAAARQATRVWVAWTDKELLLAFDCRDKDIHSPYLRRDDPLYLEEAIELFLDPDGDRRDYLEFEVSPAAVRFDASFSGRRQGMDLAFNPDTRVAVQVDGTLNQRDDTDRGWSVELAIPFADLVGRGRRPPLPGDCWRMNLFRLDKTGTGGEASAWRPTPGDFHDLDAFGPLCFSR